ncbi:MAG: PAS domain-containing sensor histidine kinase [Patescibacteria group bacterium]
MHTTKRAQTGSTSVKSVKAKRLVLASLILMVASTVFACGYVLWAIINREPFGWSVFLTWSLILSATNGVLLAAGWFYNHYLSRRIQVMLIDWAGTSVWYWLVAPAYQYLMMSLNNLQVTVLAFAYFWEVPVVGGLSFIFTQKLFTPLNNYIQTGETEDPADLYKQAEVFPIKAFIRNLCAATGGYAIGALQLRYFADLPLVECYKNVGVGFTISFLLGLYYFLVFDSYVGLIKSKLIRQYDLKNVITTKYYQKISGIVILLVIGSFSLVVLLMVQSFQLIIKDNLNTQVWNAMHSFSTQADLQDRDKLVTLEIGKSSQTFVLDEGEGLPLTDVTTETQQIVKANRSGELRDNRYDAKLINFETFGDQKLVSVTYPADFYATLIKVVWLLVAGGLFVTALSVIVMIIVNGTLTKSITALTTSVQRAQITGFYIEPMINTGDEFESLSRAFSHFTSQNQKHVSQLNQEHARLQAAINSLDIGLLMTFEDKQILSYNAALLRVLGLKKSTKDNPDEADSVLEELRQKLQELPNLDLLDTVRQCQLDGQPFSIKEISYGNRILTIFGAPIMVHLDKIIGTIVLVEDITERKVLERSKDEFFSIASHELRTPLTSIKGNSSMILDFYKDTLKDPQLKEMITDVHESAVRLIEIVNDFLDLSRLEQGRMNFNYEEVSLEEIIESVAYEMRPVLDEKSIYLKVDKMTLDRLPRAWADKNRLKQVVYNLVGNAAKFTEEGGITISAETDKDTLKVKVTDTGRGMTPESQQLLFHKFQQASSSLLTRDTTRGTGLGLYISKMIVESMGGNISLDESIEEQGSTFSFTVPIVTDVLKKLTADQQEEAKKASSEATK